MTGEFVSINNIIKLIESKKAVVSVVGLGYVGLPLAVAFGRSRRTIGLDLNEEKLAHYRAGRDPSGEALGHVGQRAGGSASGAAHARHLAGRKYRYRHGRSFRRRCDAIHY